MSSEPKKRDRYRLAEELYYIWVPLWVSEGRTLSQLQDHMINHANVTDFRLMTVEQKEAFIERLKKILGRDAA